MTADMIRDLVKRQPFSPFMIHMNDGRKFEIKHPEFVVLPPGWRSTVILVWPNERFDFVAIRNVTSVESKGPVPVPSDRRKGEEPED